jgi:serine/threonine-protein kinase
LFRLVREQAEQSPLIGSVVEERYRIEEKLGAGAMGCVYRGRHIKVGRTVAIKVLHDHLVVEPTMVERFEREARVAAKLKHPNLVAVIDIGAAPDGQKLMVLEYAPGASLAELVRAPLPRERVVSLTRQLLSGLAHAHELGLIHRDLKPENVLVESGGDGTEVARIVDFGIAMLREPDGSAEGQRLTTTGLVLGTPMYMAPEQARGELVDGRTDLFALGVIVYEMLAGVPPFEGSGLEIMMQNMTLDPPSILARTGRDVDGVLEAFARKLMAREAADRFASAAEALEMLEVAASVPQRVDDADATARHVAAAVQVERLVVAPEVMVEQPPLRRRSWGRAIGAAAGALAALVVVTLAPDGGHATQIVAPHVDVAPSAEEIECRVAETTRLLAPGLESSLPIERSSPVKSPVRTASVKRVVIARAVESAAPRVAREAPELIAREAPESIADDSARAVADAYVRVGRLLRDRVGVDPLWHRFRMIRLDAALATPASRRAALEQFAMIERELAR